MVDTKGIRVQKADEVGIQRAGQASKTCADHEGEQFVPPGLHAGGLDQDLVLANRQQYAPHAGVQDQCAQHGGQHRGRQHQVVVADAAAEVPNKATHREVGRARHVRDAGFTTGERTPGHQHDEDDHVVGQRHDGEVVALHAQARVAGQHRQRGRHQRGGRHRQPHWPAQLHAHQRGRISADAHETSLGNGHIAGETLDQVLSLRQHHPDQRQDDQVLVVRQLHAQWQQQRRQRQHHQAHRACSVRVHRLPSKPSGLNNSTTIITRKAITSL